MKFNFIQNLSAWADVHILTCIIFEKKDPHPALPHGGGI